MLLAQELGVLFRRQPEHALLSKSFGGGLCSHRQHLLTGAHRGHLFFQTGQLLLQLLHQPLGGNFLVPQAFQPGGEIFYLLPGQNPVLLGPFQIFAQLIPRCLQPDRLLLSGLDLRVDSANGGLYGGKLLGKRFAARFQLGHLLFQFLRFTAQLFNFGSAAKSPGPPGGGAAGKGASGIDDLTIQGDNPQGIPRCFGNSVGAVQILSHADPPQKLLHHLLQAGLRLYQIGSQAKIALLPPNGGDIGGAASLDGVEGQKGRPACLCALEHPNGPFGHIVGFHHDVLHGGS